ncbi:MAG: hypothetical protein GY724_25110 [Actinomycetia bacterium]|nr:hypothetical protein [Actinomycetes bacterium]MCP4223455.1 hypothetical protein [Actinomycetes bacterium]MCP5031991.1 hypothetical protein [Actinomycetes bacterium]
MTKKLINALAVVVMMVGVMSCGSDAGGSGSADDSGGSDNGNEATNAADTGFDESQLPDNFPTELIPPAYSSGTYLDIDDLNSAAFESSTPINETIDHYTDLIGEPKQTVEGDTGEKTAMWEDGGWIVSVIGSPEESFIGIAEA